MKRGQACTVPYIDGCSSPHPPMRISVQSPVRQSRRILMDIVFHMTPVTQPALFCFLSVGAREKWKKRNVFVYEMLENQTLQEPVCLLCNVTVAACVFGRSMAAVFRQPGAWRRAPKWFVRRQSADGSSFSR